MAASRDPYQTLANGEPVTISAKKARELLNNAENSVRLGPVYENGEYSLEVTPPIASTCFFSLSERQYGKKVAMGEL
jgi:hypothetical protein